MKKLTTDRMRYELSQKDKGKKDSKSSGFVNDAHRKWFGDSKVVDAEGKPLVVYHGTNADISTFDTAKQDPRDAGFWFANEPVYANQYAAGRSGGNVLPVYLSLKNPKVYYDRTVPITTALIKELKAQGYDGIVRDFAGGEEAWRYAPGQREYAVFDPHQIKSAIGNRGTFDPNNPDITKARGGPVYNMDAMRLRLAERGLPHLAIGGQGPRNWIKGSVEKVLAPLKSRGPAEADREWLEQHGEQYPEARRMGLEAIPRNEAINQWVERNLANYVRKQMGATNDPIRKLAEEGIVHYEPQGFVVPAEQEEHANYIRQSNNWQRLAKSNRAKAWEDVTDSSVHQNTVDDLKESVIRRPEVYKDMVEPWMEKADPSTPLLRPSTSMTAQLLGFDHLVDVLMEDMAQGRIRPDQLSKVSIEHAVRRAHEYDQERKKVMAETALKATEGMPVHKDYGDGFKWIELALPEKGEHLLTELDKRIIADRKDNPVSPEVMDRTLDQRAHKKLADALKYEGDTMGHCVGNYPNRVANGDSRIFSLRDEKNEPHVTVEVNPPKQYDEDDIIERFPGGVTDAMRQGDIGAKKYIAKKLAEINNNLPAIKQIKGKQNRAPKDQYLPYVQDFVRSGNWSEINDTRNAGLRRYSDVFNDNEQRAIEATGEPVPDHEWLTGADIQRLHNAITPEGKRLKYDAKGNIVGGDYGSGMKHGGVARSASGSAKYNMDAMRLRLAEGGSTRSGKK